MHPKEKADTITILENIGHFLRSRSCKVYKKQKRKALIKMKASAILLRILICKNTKKVCKKLGWWLCHGRTFGHGDAFVLRDPAGIRPAYYYKDDEVVVVA